jgi:hypothetical protein
VCKTRPQRWYSEQLNHTINVSVYKPSKKTIIISQCFSIEPFKLWQQIVRYTSQRKNELQYYCMLMKPIAISISYTNDSSFWCGSSTPDEYQLWIWGQHAIVCFWKVNCCMPPVRIVILRTVHLVDVSTHRITICARLLLTKARVSILFWKTSRDTWPKSDRISHYDIWKLSTS